MTADRTVRTIALLILMAAATAMCLQIAWLARGLRIDLIPQAQAVVQKANVTLDNGNAAIKVQEGYWNAELQETRKATADLHDVIIHTDIALNGRHGDTGILGDIHATFIPHLVAVLDASNVAIIHTAATVDRIGDSTDAVVSKVGKAVDALNVRIEDPQYNEILANADQSMRKPYSGYWQRGAQSLKTADEVVSKEAAIILAPVSKIKVAVMFALQGAGEIFWFLRVALKNPTLREN